MLKETLPSAKMGFSKMLFKLFKKRLFKKGTEINKRKKNNLNNDCERLKKIVETTSYKNKTERKET